ncbi:MAG: polymerase subunit epsilon [Patescibacteria group bacterium]|jgi:DNA polymerase III epsilon subunit-like protein|nr:polymerase subunit epsilon [Patescibacteria group bacterium]
MIIVDIETTGTNPSAHSIISIGAVDMDDPTREFKETCRAFPGAKVEKEATAINGVSQEEAFNEDRQTDEEILKHFIVWMKDSRDHTVAGQNPHFDVSFLEATAKRYHLDISIPHRIIDMHSMTILHMANRGINYPVAHNRSDLNSDKIMEYVGIPAEVRPHVAINGARIEAEAISRLLWNKSFYEEYEQYAIPWKI